MVFLCEGHVKLLLCVISCLEANGFRQRRGSVLGKLSNYQDQQKKSGDVKNIQSFFLAGLASEAFGEADSYQFERKLNTYSDPRLSFSAEYSDRDTGLQTHVTVWVGVESFGLLFEQKEKGARVYEEVRSCEYKYKQRKWFFRPGLNGHGFDHPVYLRIQDEIGHEERHSQLITDLARRAPSVESNEVPNAATAGSV
jgi:hypothetical protein